MREHAADRLGMDLTDRLPDKSEARAIDEYITRFNSLADKLPKRGRLQYNADGIAPYRKDIDRTVQMLLRTNPEATQAHKKALSEIARRGKALSETGTSSDYVKRLNKEYKSRLGNVVL